MSPDNRGSTVPQSSSFVYELLKTLVTSSLFYSFGKLFSAISPIQFFIQVSVPIRCQLTLRFQGHCFGKQC